MNTLCCKSCEEFNWIEYASLIICMRMSLKRFSLTNLSTGYNNSKYKQLHIGFIHVACCNAHFPSSLSLARRLHKLLGRKNALVPRSYVQIFEFFFDSILFHAHLVCNGYRIYTQNAISWIIWKCSFVIIFEVSQKTNIFINLIEERMWLKMLGWWSFFNGETNKPKKTSSTNIFR